MPSSATRVVPPHLPPNPMGKTAQQEQQQEEEQE